MARKVAERGQKAKRPPVGIPYISLGLLRRKLDLTLEVVCERIGEETGNSPLPATLSAIENGHRGASIEMIDALATVYGIDPDDIETAYEPRRRVREMS